MGTNDLIGKQECMKTVKEFNRETAKYGSLMLALGAIYDTDNLRDELKKSRKKAYELAKQNKVKLLPHLRGNQCKKDEIEEYEKLWNLFSSCLELLEQLLCKTVRLEQAFPLHAGTSVFIQTGLSEFVWNSRGKPVAIVPLDGTSSGPEQAELNEQRILQRDICDIRSMVVEIHEIVDIKPWAIEPVLTTHALSVASEHSLKSASSASPPAIEVVAVLGVGLHRRRRLICIGMIVVAVVAAIIGLAVGLTI